MKKRKESDSFPAEGTPYRPSYSLGLWLTALQVLSMIVPMAVPAAVGLAIATKPSVALLVGITVPVGFLVSFMIAWPVAALIGRCHRPHARACLSEGRLYLTDRQRAVPVADVTALELNLGEAGKHHPRPPASSCGSPTTIPLRSPAPPSVSCGTSAVPPPRLPFPPTGRIPCFFQASRALRAGWFWRRYYCSRIDPTFIWKANHDYGI